MRTETRKERYEKKTSFAKTYPFEVATFNFQVEENVAFVVRGASCFGASAVNVIGSIPPRNVLVARSGTTQNLVKINQFSKTHDFLEYIRKNDIHLISAEMCEDAISIYDYEFPINKRMCVVVGHETHGVPTEILMNSDKVFIPMPGRSYNLNTSQAGTIFMYEISKQYEISKI